MRFRYYVTRTCIDDKTRDMIQEWDRTNNDKRALKSMLQEKICQTKNKGCKDAEQRIERISDQGEDAGVRA